MSRPEEKVAAINAILPKLARLESAVERSAWAGRLADALRIDDDLVMQELRNALRAAKPGIRATIHGRGLSFAWPAMKVAM